MTTDNKISVETAIDILKSGKDLGGRIISNLETSKVSAMDALLLAENGFVVPDINVIYKDSDIEYDPDFDEVDWGKPVPFNQNKKRQKTPSVVEELVVRLSIENAGMKEWLEANRKKLDPLILKLLKDLYETEKLLKHF